MKIHHRVRHHAKRIHYHFRIVLLLTPLILFAGFLFWSFEKPANTTKPLNVILISIDSLRTDHMGIYGYHRNTTPHIDAWAKDAVVFKNYFSTSFLTPISETSVHTGKYPFSNGVINFEATLPTSTPTLATILHEKGWQTGAFGSSAEFNDYPSGASLKKGFDTYELSHAGEDTFNGRGGNPSVTSIEWIKQASKKEKPFFLWLTLGSAHWPYGHTEEHHFSSSTYAGYFDTAGVNTWQLVDYLYKGSRYGRTVRGEKLKPLFAVTNDDFRYIVDRYDDGLVMTDRRLGQLLEYLKNSGLDEHTVVILQSEHGEGFNERGYIMHYDIFDEQTHTPLIIKAPTLKPQQVADLASGVDVLPTLLTILGIPLPEHDGVDLLRKDNTKDTPAREEVFITRTALWEREMASMGYEGFTGFLDADNKEHFADTAIRNKEWKLIHRRARFAMERWGWFNNFLPRAIPIPEYELYDLSNDPGETHDVFERSKTNPTIIYLQERLERWEAEQFGTPQPETTYNELQPYF